MSSCPATNAGVDPTSLLELHPHVELHNSDGKPDA